MRVTVTLITLAVCGTAAAIVACTAMPGGPRSALESALRTYTARSYAVAQKPHKIRIAKLVADDALKLTVTDFDSDNGIKKTAGTLRTKADDGDDEVVYETVATCQAAVLDATPHTIEMIADHWPVMGDHDNECTVTDKTTGNVLFFEIDQEFQKYIVTKGEQRLTIITNPDGTYTVDGKPAPTLAEAAALIVANPVGRSASLQSLGAIYATLLERREFLTEEAQVAVAAMQPFQTLAPTDCGDRKTTTGPGPADPADLVRAILVQRQKQP